MSELTDKLLRAATRTGEVIDEVTQAVAPGYALRRSAARSALEVQASYKGASRGKRMKGFRGQHRSVNTETRRSLATLRARSRELAENSDHAARGIEVIARNTVGNGIIPTARGDEQTELWLKQMCDRASLDPRGRLTLYAIQTLVMRTASLSGESLVLRERLSSAQMRAAGATIPLQLRVLEPDHLDSLVDGVLPNGNIAIQGVEFTPGGRPVAYHLYQQHPGELTSWRRIESVRVPASEVAHVFKDLRPNQVRGIPDLAPVIVRMRDFADYEDAQLMRQKIAAAYAMFVTTPESLHGETGLWDEDGVPGSVRPGMIEYLKPGESIEYGAPPGVDGYADFSRISLRGIASGLGITYESLTGDYSQVNFSSGRMGWLEMQRNIEAWQSQVMIPQFCHRVEGWLREAAASVGMRPAPAPWDWMPPRREMIDPVRETNATVTQIRAGLTSRNAEIRRLGRDPEDVNQEIARGNKQADDLGLLLDSDPRKATAQGQYQITTNEDE